MRAFLASLSLMCPLLACGGASAPEPTEPASTQPAPEAESPAPQSVEEQAARGGELYGANCAGCHGDAGQGGDKAPPLVGAQALPLDPRPGAKRAVQFKTALDVFTWVKANMPPTKGGSLADDEYVAILAFALKANGVTLEQPLDGEQAASLNLH